MVIISLPYDPDPIRDECQSRLKTIPPNNNDTNWSVTFSIAPFIDAMLNYTRRTLLKRGTEFAALSSLAAFPSSLMGMHRSRPHGLPADSAPRINDPNVKILSDAALSTAQAAGATYADVRLTHTFRRVFGNGLWDGEGMHFGVRTLVDGYWGFAASPIWTPDEAVRLARAAVENAKANTLGKPRVVDLAPVKAIANGQWTMPVLDDPFVVSEDEIQDFLNGIQLFISQLPWVNPGSPGAA